MDRIRFKINGKDYSVGNEVPAETSLVSYLRYYAQLPGTKAMCREGGCGACIVTVTAPHPYTKELHTFSVNTCLVLVMSCDGWELTTVEGVGNRLQGYHPVQTRLTQFNGTQCGYCTPGWINQMYSLLGKNLTMAEIENSFGSNTCRCTGYRSILDSMKTFAVDAPPELLKQVDDIEDIPKLCSKRNKICNKRCSESDSDEWCFIDNTFCKTGFKEDTIKRIFFNDHKFYEVYSIEDIFAVFAEAGIESYTLIAGNTGKGIYEVYEYPTVLIDISRVEELRGHQIDQNLDLGANMSLEDTKNLFTTLSKNQSDFSYLSYLAEHIDLVAHIPVRNIGTIAGNLTLKNRTPTFSSDIFLLLATVGAILTIRGPKGFQEKITMAQFLNYNMKGKIIYRVSLPPLGKDYYFRSYKILPRNQNAHAIVNAGFLFEFDNKFVIKSASIVYGGLSGEFVYARETQDFVTGKNIFDNKNLQETLKILSNELVVTEIPPEPPSKIRKKLALGLFYKVVLNLCPEDLINPRYRSGGKKLLRGLSKGNQSYETDSTQFPIDQPLPKLEGLIQCSGEAQYANDLPPFNNEVFGAFVLSTVHNGQIDEIDKVEVTKLKGILAVYTAKDIPGKNRFIKPFIKFETHSERILADGNIKYHGEPVAIVVADTEENAAKAARLVKVTYKNVSQRLPILRIEEAKKDPLRIFPNIPRIPKGRGLVVDKTINGTFISTDQYHYTMETQHCVVVPIDRGLEVYSATQWIQITHIAVAEALDMPMNRIQMIVRRIGGGFGGKATRSAQVAAACALVSKIRNVPCRFVLPMQTNMKAIGKRSPCYAKYSVGFTKEGKIQFVDLELTNGDGCSHNELYITYLATDSVTNCYEDTYWGCLSTSVLTDLPSNTIMRSPGTAEGSAIAEQILEHIAFDLDKDPLNIKQLNMKKDDNPLPEMSEKILKEADYDERYKAVKQFNKENRWMKKSIKISFIEFSIKYIGNFTAFVTVFEGDGTVTVSTGGIEMGQGINTKVVQACAKTLNIPIEYVNVEPNYSIIAANDVFSANSITSEIVCHCVIKACETILDRIAPFRSVNVSWKEAIATAGKALIDLKAEYQFSKFDLGAYLNHGVAILELQTDILTGQHQILRVDMLQDTGVSLNPLLDLGQIEGAYVKGLGYWLTERLLNDPKTGKLLTNRSWNYYVPLAKDIPIEFNVQFRHNTKNKKGITGSKSVGEVTLCLANGAMFAARDCIHESRIESGYRKEWRTIEPPFDVETILREVDVKLEEFLIE